MPNFQLSISQNTGSPWCKYCQAAESTPISLRMPVTEGPVLDHKEDCKKVGCKSRSPESQVVSQTWNQEEKNNNFRFKKQKIRKSRDAG